MNNGTANSAKQKSDELELGLFFKELRSRWYYFVISFAGLALLALLYVKYSLPVYRATSSILIQDDSQSGSRNLDNILLGDFLGSTESVATEMGVLGSRTVLQETIRTLQLAITYYNRSGFPHQTLYRNAPFVVTFDSLHPALYDIPFEVIAKKDNQFWLFVERNDDRLPDFSLSRKFTYGEVISTPQFRLKIDRLPGIETAYNARYAFVINSSARSLGQMRDELKIETLNKDASILVLTYDDIVQQRAVDILNEIGRSYIRLDIREKTTVASLTLQFVDQQLESTSRQLREIESELQDFKEKNKTVDLSAESTTLLGKINQIETQRTKSQIELQTLDNLLEYVTSNRELEQLAPSSLGLPDPLLVELIENFQQLQARRKSISYGVKSGVPALKILDQQIADTRASLIENIKSIKQNISVTNDMLSGQIAGYESSIGRIPATERELLDIQRRAEVNQNIYVYLLQKQAETSIAKATVVSDNKVLDEAVLLEEPVSPNIRLLIVLTLFGGLVLPVIFLVLRNAFKTTIGNRDEISRLTGIPILGVVGHLDQSDNLAVIHKPKSAIAESFRSIRANLQFMGTGDKKKIILITSSVGSEGKSFVSINMATIFALQGYKVAVVGLDLRKPKLFQDFNLGNDIGVSSYLIGQATADQIVRSTSIENLDLISSGPVPPNPAELLTRTEMKTLFDYLRERYDFIVVDTPPLGIVADALLLMNHSDINIYLVRENFSKYEYVKSLNEMVAERKLKNISIILNDSDFSKRYGYGYGHNYGYLNGGSGYYDEDQSSRSFLGKLFRRGKQGV